MARGSCVAKALEDACDGVDCKVGKWGKLNDKDDLDKTRVQMRPTRDARGRDTDRRDAELVCDEV